MAKVNRSQDASRRYSLDPLPGDEWEVRRTKQILRAVVRQKNELKMTTEELAKRCAKFLDVEEFKPATLNGLFSGKRKSVSATELEMFSAVLHCSVLDLLYPPGEEIEAPDGSKRPSGAALVANTHVMLPTASGPIWVGGRVASIVELMSAYRNVEHHMVNLIGTYRLGYGESRTREKYFQLGWALSALEHRIEEHEKGYSEPPPYLPSGISHLLDLALEAPDSPDGFSMDLVLPRILDLEPYFEGHSFGRYKLGANHATAADSAE